MPDTRSSGFAGPMNPLVLVTYASKHGSTEEVALEIAGRLSAHGIVADVRATRDVSSLQGYEAVVLGSAIYMGRLHADARAFLHRHRAGLAERPLAVFAMGPRSLETDDVAGSRKALDAALAKEAPLEALSTAIFGGVLDPTQLHFPFNRMPAADARDWDAIRAWGDEAAERIAPQEAVAA
jgi:menaquinone-dependent protoporphyrinogen oxidase